MLATVVFLLDGLDCFLSSLNSLQIPASRTVRFGQYLLGSDARCPILGFLLGEILYPTRPQELNHRMCGKYSSVSLL